jgi:hypothetical protein
MSLSNRLICWAVATSIFGAPAKSLACGFEDPTSAAAARGVLNWAFPDSLHISTAVWQAQAAGIIGRDQIPPAAKALLGYQKATARLSAFRDGLVAGLNGEAVPSVSVVMLGPMLWTRFEPNGVGVDMAIHASGPASGETVIVTDEPVIAALGEGRLTPHDARKLGLLRLYGPAASVTKLANWLDRWPERTTRGAAGTIH